MLLIRPYKHIVMAIKETTKRLYDVHSQKLDAYNKKSHKLCGNELIPDLWNE